MVWHLFRKDVGLLWPFAAVLAIAQALNGILHFILHQSLLTSLPFAYVTILFPAVPLLGMACLAVTVVQQDCLPGTTQDWLVRPVKRGELLLAKILFVSVMIHVPIALLDCTEAALSGFSIAGAMQAAVVRNVVLFAAVTSPALLLGAVTRSLAEALFFGGSLILGYTLVVLLLPELAPLSSPRGPVGLSWIPDTMAQIGILVCAAMILLFQYLRRRTLAARTFVAMASAPVIALSFLPFGACFAVQQWLSPAGADSSRVEIGVVRDPSARKRNVANANSADAANWRRAFLRSHARLATPLEFPIRVGQLPRNSLLQADRIVLRLVGNDGRLLYQGVGDCANASQGPGVECVPGELEVMSSPDSSVDSRQLILIPNTVYSRLRSQPLRVEIEYALTVSVGRPRITLGVNAAFRQLGGVGRCQTGIDDDGDEIDLTCASTQAPPSCITVILEDPKTGLHNPAMHQCGINYSPFIRNPYFDVLAHFRIGLPFSDASQLVHFPVDAAQIQGARVAITTYEPIAHFQRKSVIPEIRLSEWRAQDAIAASQTVSGSYRNMN